MLVPSECQRLADDQHPDHQHRINRGSADRGIMRRQLVLGPGQVENRRNLAYQMISWNRRIEIERIEQLPLVSIVPTSRIAIAGDSVGGNMTAVVALSEIK